MASYPPPPPGQPPFSFDPRAQQRFVRQQMKDQARAQKASLRAQQDFLRQQSRALRRTSVVGPLLVVAIGVVALLISTGRLALERFAVWFANWWPLLLVAAGLVLLLEWVVDRATESDGNPVVRRSFLGAGTAFLLSLIAIAGILAHTVHRHGERLIQQFHIGPEDIGELYGQKHELPPQMFDQPFPAGSSLVIDDPHGDVTISGTSPDGKVHITVNKSIFGWNESRAEEKGGQLDPKIEMTGATLHITLPAVQSGISDLVITKPDFGDATVIASRGNVTVSTMHAGVNVTANRGDVETSAITGPVFARINRRNSSFTAHGIAGDVSVRGEVQDVNVTDVSGQTSLEGEFYGDTHLERLRGALNFHTSRTQFSLLRLDGEVDISPNSELTGSEIVGPVQLRTRSRNISFQRIAGDVTVTNSDGSVDLTAAPPMGNVTVENRNGAVDLVVPERAGFSVQAETNGGSIDNDLNLEPATDRNNARLHGTVGNGGANVSIRTSHFDIGIHHQQVLPLPPSPPNLPSVPAGPAPPGVPALPAVPSTPALPRVPKIPAIPRTPPVPARM